MTKPVAGVLPVVHTPFLPDGEIDESSLRREIDFVYGHGADGIVLAMASNLLRLTEAERLRLTRLFVEQSAGRGCVIISCGAESVEQARVYAQAAEAAGADALTAIPPVAVALSEDGLTTYYGGIAESVSLPIVVQDASGYVGRPMTPVYQASLLHRFGADKMLFKPESFPIGAALSGLRDATDGQAQILEGTGGMYLVDSYRRGITGTMPGSDVIDAIVALWRALEAGDEERIYQIHMPLASLIGFVNQGGLDGYINCELHILHRRGIIDPPASRVPHSGWPDPESIAELDRLVDRLLAVL